MKFWMTRFAKWGGLYNRIEPVEGERATESTVWIKGRRNAMRSSYLNYFPTWAEAHAWLMEQADADLADARKELARAQSIHGNIKGMKPPVENVKGHEK